MEPEITTLALIEPCGDGLGRVSRRSDGAL